MQREQKRVSRSERYKRRICGLRSDLAQQQELAAGLLKLLESSDLSSEVRAAVTEYAKQLGLCARPVPTNSTDQTK